MTPDERAEKIIGRWRPYMKVFGPTKGFPKNKGSMQDDIAAEIREAVLDDREQRTADDLYALSRKVGAREAYEDAAKIAEYHSGPSVQLAEKIRARAKELT